MCQFQNSETCVSTHYNHWLVCQNIIIIGNKSPEWSLNYFQSWLLNSPLLRIDDTLISSEDNTSCSPVVRGKGEVKFFTGKWKPRPRYKELILKRKQETLIKNVFSANRPLQYHLWYVNEETTFSINSKMENLVRETKGKWQLM